MTKSLTGRQRKALKILAITLIVIGIVVISYPFFPLIRYSVSEPEPYYPFATQLVNDDESNNLPDIERRETSIPLNEAGIPLENYLVVPKIGVYIKIIEGTNEGLCLNQGAWHLPDTSNPVAGSNMVISAHRFRYRPPSSETFYLLDKIVNGDNFIVYWEEQEYDYVVTETKIVEPNKVSIKEATESPRVTLFTCTPLFSTDKRLVVIGEPI